MKPEDNELGESVRSMCPVTQKMGPISESNGIISFDVTVTNIGATAGKDVAEVYYNPPYLKKTGYSPKRKPLSKICKLLPSHGVIWRDNPGQIVEAYAKWADAYQENQITVAYDTMWEGAAKLARAVAAEISRQSPDTVVKVYNIAKTDKTNS